MAAASLKEYLKRYGPDDQIKKKKKNDKRRANPMGAGILVLDVDPVWQKPNVEEEEESAGKSRPTTLTLNLDSDLSPPRQCRRRVDTPSPEPRMEVVLSALNGDLSPPRRSRKGSVADLSPPSRGLQKLPDSRRRRSSAVHLSLPRRRKEPSLAKEKKLEWATGLAQKREAEARMKELELEKGKPFARTKDDTDLERMLKERIRRGDPTAHLLKNSEPESEDLGTDEERKDDSFIIQRSIPEHSWIKRGIGFPPNCYGIRPGRHWDGVDRDCRGAANKIEPLQTEVKE